jgi:hypothetical protein
MDYLTLLDPRSGATVSFSVSEPSMAADELAYHVPRLRGPFTRGDWREVDRFHFAPVPSGSYALIIATGLSKKLERLSRRWSTHHP